MRLISAEQKEIDFAKWQLEVGHRKYTDNHNDINIPPEFHLPENTVEALINNIYPGLKDMPHPHDRFFAERSILSARNDDVDDINKRILADFPGQEKVFHSADSVKELGEGQLAMYPVEYLNFINVSGLPLAKLSLKV